MNTAFVRCPPDDARAAFAHARRSRRGGFSAAPHEELARRLELRAQLLGLALGGLGAPRGLARRLARRLLELVVESLAELRERARTREIESRGKSVRARPRATIRFDDTSSGLTSSSCFVSAALSPSSSPRRVS